MTKNVYPKIEVILDHPVSGYWDGGKKDRFTFTPSFFQKDSSMETASKKFLPKDEIRWGSFGANFFFGAKSGRNWKEAISIAERKIKRLYNGEAKIIRFEIFWNTQEDLEF